MSADTIDFISKLAQNWGGQAVFALLVWAFLSQKISNIERAIADLKMAVNKSCTEHEKLHDRATKNESAINYLKGKLNGHDPS